MQCVQEQNHVERGVLEGQRFGACFLEPGSRRQSSRSDQRLRIWIDSGDVGAFRNEAPRQSARAAPDIQNPTPAREGMTDLSTAMGLVTLADIGRT